MNLEKMEKLLSESINKLKELDINYLDLEKRDMKDITNEVVIDLVVVIMEIQNKLYFERK